MIIFIRFYDYVKILLRFVFFYLICFFITYNSIFRDGHEAYTLWLSYLLRKQYLTQRKQNKNAHAYKIHINVSTEKFNYRNYAHPVLASRLFINSAICKIIPNILAFSISSLSFAARICCRVFSACSTSCFLSVLNLNFFVTNMCQEPSTLAVFL